MRRLDQRHTTQRWARPVPRQTTICIVDPNADDYEIWQATAEESGVRLMFCATAEEALRFSRTAPVDLWVVNAVLPGLSGLEVCSMIKARDTRTPVYIVAEEYSSESERAAWAARATVFGCKGAHGAWLRHWLLQQHSASTPSPSELGCAAH